MIWRDRARRVPRGPQHRYREYVVIATGTGPARPKEVEFDNDHVIDSDAVLRMQGVPGSLVVVGAGVIGIEYASMFAALGTRVTVVEKRPQMLEVLRPALDVANKMRALSAFGDGNWGQV